MGGTDPLVGRGASGGVGEGAVPLLAPVVVPVEPAVAVVEPVESAGAVVEPVEGPAVTAVVVVAVVEVVEVVAGWERLVTVELVRSPAVVVTFVVALDPLLQAPTSNAITTRPPRQADMSGEPTADGDRTVTTHDWQLAMSLSPWSRSGPLSVAGLTVSLLSVI